MLRNRLGRRLAAPVVAAALALIYAAPSFAQEVLFEDNFTELDASFGEPREEFKTAGGELLMQLPPNMWHRYMYQSVILEDCDITVRVQLPNYTQQKGSGVGIMFWGMDPTDCYVFEVIDFGEVVVRKFTPTRELRPVAWQSVPALKTEPGAWNELRVRLVGDVATFFINGQELWTIKGKPPAGGSLLGVFYETAEIQDSGKMAALKVTEPVGTPPAQPAAPSGVLFADNYQTLHPTLGVPSDIVSVDHNELAIKLGGSQWTRLFYNHEAYDDVDVSVKVKLTDLTAEAGSGAGLMFWGNSISDMYFVELGDSGTFCVRRFLPNDKFLYPIVWRESEAINTDPDAWNELRVVTRGKRATVYINGQEQASVKGAGPEGGSLVGYFAETGEGEGDEMRFKDFVVKQPEASAEPAPQEEPGTLLADDFESLDPSWGAESGTFGVKDGKLAFSVEKGKGSWKFYEGGLFQGDLDQSIKIWVNDGNDESIGNACLVFWGEAYDDFWTFDINDNGTTAVGHFFKTKGWLWPMKPKVIPAEANYDPNGPTELRVVTEGRKATFSINGVEVGTISGQPPKEGTYVGMYVGGGTVDLTAQFDDLLIKQNE